MAPFFSFSVSPGWEACEDFMDLADVTPQTVRRPVSWQGTALKLEAALNSVKVAFQQQQERRSRQPSGGPACGGCVQVKRDPAVALREHTLEEYEPLEDDGPDPDAAGSGVRVCRWAGLTEKEKKGAKVLGYTSTIWDSNEVPPYCCNSQWETDAEEVRCWEELSEEQQLAAGTIGYSQASWDEGMRGGVVPPDNGAAAMFSANEYAYAMDPTGEAYQAKVLQVRRSKKVSNRWEYKVHYSGWPAKFDEWMDSRRIFKRTHVNMVMLEITDSALSKEMKQKQLSRSKAQAKKGNEEKELDRILGEMKK
eukprot:SAG22_NODE_5671_length_974_cov_1.226286_1_plen_307_part_01